MTNAKSPMEFIGHITWLQWDTVGFCYRDENNTIVEGQAPISKFHLFTPENITRDTEFKIQLPQCDFIPLKEKTLSPEDYIQVDKELDKALPDSLFDNLDYK